MTASKTGMPRPTPTPSGTLRFFGVGFPYPLQEYPGRVDLEGKVWAHAEAADAQSTEKVEFMYRVPYTSCTEDIFKLHVSLVENNARQGQEPDLVTFPVMERDSATSPIGAKLTFKGIPASRVK